MAISLVQHTTKTGINTTSPNVTFSATGSGHLLIAVVAFGQYTGNPTLTTPSGWTAKPELTQNIYTPTNGQVFYFENCPSGLTSATFTASAVPKGWGVHFFEFSGVATSGGPDAYAGSAPGTYSTSPSQSITTTAPGDLVLGVCNIDPQNGGATLTEPSSPWTSVAAIQDGNGFVEFGAAYQVQGSAGAITYNPTSSGNTDYMIWEIAFKAATVVQRTSGSSTGFGGFDSSVTSSNFGSAVSSGDAIIVAVQTVDPSNIVQSVTDTQGNGYSRIASVHNSSMGTSMEIWAALNVTGGSSFNVTATDNLHTELGGIIALDVSGLVTSGTVLDTSVSATSGSSSVTSLASGSLTSTNASDLLVGFANNGSLSGTTGWGVTAGYSSPYANFWSAGIGNAEADKTVTTTGSYSVTFTQTTAGEMTAILLALKTATGGSILTKTQSATARIANNITKTQSATARIRMLVSKTQSAIARVANVLTKTQSAVARVANNRTKTQSAVATVTQSMATFADPFNRTSVDSTKWAQATAGGATMTFDATGATVTYPSSSTASTAGSVSAIANYDLTGSYAYVQVLAVPSSSTNADAEMALLLDSNNWLRWVYEGGTLYAQYMVAGTRNNATTFSYSSATHKFWRIRESGGTTYWDTSPDGSTWTNQASMANPISVKSLNVVIDGSCYEAETNPGTYKWNDFNTPPATVRNTTQTAVARVANSVTKTQPATARIVSVLTKTQSAIARIAQAYTKTQSAVARIASTSTKTQPATARIQRILTKTQSAVGRIATVLTKTQSSIARISNTRTLSQPATARIQRILNSTQSATARIVFVFSKTQGAIARIAQNYTKTQTSVARIAVTGTKTQGAIARIAATLSKTQGALGRIAVTTTKTQGATSRIANTLTKTQSATAAITTASANSKTQGAVARIANTIATTQSAIARIVVTTMKTQGATARIRRVLAKTQPAVARIADTRTNTQTAMARVAIIPTKTQASLARIANTLSKTQSAIARISHTFTKMQGAVVRISNTPTKTQAAVARIQQRLFLTQSATANIIQSGISQVTQSAVARIQQAISKAQPALARIARVLEKTQSATARIAQTYTKTQSAVSRISQTYTKTQPAKARIARTLVTAHPATGRIQVVAIKTLPAASRISQTYTNTQSATSRISKTFTTLQTALARIANQLSLSQSAVARIELALSATQSCTARIITATELIPHPSLVLSQLDTSYGTLSAVDRVAPVLSQAEPQPALGATEYAAILEQSDTNGAVL